MLPQAIIVVDKYHVARMGNEALERYQRSLKASLPPKVNLCLKHDRKLLLMRQRDLAVCAHALPRRLSDHDHRQAPASDGTAECPALLLLILCDRN